MKTAADLRGTMREALDDLGGGCDGITGGEPRAGGDGALAARLVAIHEMDACERRLRISVHGLPFLHADRRFPKMAKSGQYMPQRSQPEHFSAFTTKGAW